MEKFAAYLMANVPDVRLPGHHSLEALRAFAVEHPREFMQFRSGIASDFLADMRRYARSVKHGAFITCNNSLNSPDALFSQCRRFGYNIDQLSRVEDWITIEDMVSQPRSLADGRTIEYGPTYKLLRAISHEKPVVAVTLADADYHTPPNLVRLAMAEAAANSASYLSWPTWPAEVRQKMEETIRPEADFLRRNEKLLNDIQPRCDVALLFAFDGWLQTTDCKASTIAAALVRDNIQFTVISASELEPMFKQRSPPTFVILTEQLPELDAEQRRIIAAFQQRGGHVVQASQPDWLAQIHLLHPSLNLKGSPTVRAVVADQRNRTMVHLYNLGIERLSSFEDKVHPAQDIRVTVRVPFAEVHSACALTADADATSGPMKFSIRHKANETFVDLIIPRLEISTLLVIDGAK